MANIVDDDVVMLAPKKRNGREGFSSSEHVERRGLALPFGDVPMFNPNAGAAVTIGPTRNIARREYSWSAGLQKLVDDDAAIDGEAGRFRKFKARTHADAADDEIRLQLVAASECHATLVNRRRDILEMKDYAALLMQVTHKIADPQAECALHWPLLRRDDMDFDSTPSQ